MYSSQLRCCLDDEGPVLIHRLDKLKLSYCTYSPTYSPTHRLMCLLSLSAAEIITCQSVDTYHFHSVTILMIVVCILWREEAEDLHNEFFCTDSVVPPLSGYEKRMRPRQSE